MKNVLSNSMIASAFIALLGIPVFAQNTTLEQEIQPLDCTKSETINGHHPTLSLKPQECNDFIKPTTGIDNNSSNQVPEVESPSGHDTKLQVFDTELFRDPTADVQFVFFLGFLGILLVVLLRARSLGHLRKPSKLAIITRRVSSFGRRRKN